jgi:hypothetical protein
MKQKDAERLAKATEAFLGRLRAAADKLSAREETVLAAIEPLGAINEGLEKDFEKWNELAGDSDPDGEVAPNGSAPALDLDDLTDQIEGAFESAHGALEEAIGSFEEILENATNYEEPEEDDEEEENEEEIVWNFTCEHPGCKAESPEGLTDAEAKQKARKLGWSVDGEEALCPKHA